MKIAVFGAGTMGLGIIQVFAAKGHTVLVYDRVKEEDVYVFKKRLSNFRI